MNNTSNRNRITFTGTPNTNIEAAAQPLEGFYTVKDVMALTGWSKTTTLNTFQSKDFPANNYGKGWLVTKQAFYEYFSVRRDRFADQRMSA
jgi:hypothetical protein